MAFFEQGSNNERLIGSLDMLEERREMVLVWLADYQQRLAQGYNRNVRPREFVLGDLFLCKAVGNMRYRNAVKLAPN